MKIGDTKTMAMKDHTSKIKLCRLGCVDFRQEQSAERNDEMRKMCVCVCACALRKTANI